MTKSMGIYERHGGHDTRAYGVWCGIRGRCNNPENPAYQNYGARGITVCDRWSKFSQFYADMGDPPSGMTLERVDNNKGYSPENCIWADRTAQGRNKRNNVLLTINGETAPLSVFADRSGLKYQTVHMRLRKGWSPEDAVTIAIVTNRVGIKRGAKLHKASADLIMYRGKQVTLAQAASEAGLNYSTVCQRIKHGWTIENALTARPLRGRRDKGVQA